MAKKKILIHSIVFSPDGVSTAYLYNDIAKRFMDSGYDVAVLTTTPHYNVLPEEIRIQPLTRKLFGLYYTSNYHGIKVMHVAQKKFKNSFLRILGFVYWHILSFFLGLAEKNVRLILSPSPPLTIGLINILLGRLKGAKVIYNVQEIYPDFLINQGKLKLKFIVNILKWLERFVYDKSDVVVTIDTVFYNTIVDRFKEPKKLRVIPNFVDTTLFKPMTSTEVNLQGLGFKDFKNRLIVMYAGNIGHAQSWEPLLRAAKLLRDKRVDFWVIGEGVMKSYLQEQIRTHNLDNIQLMAYQNRNIMPDLIAAADLHFIFMSPEMEGQGFPSKVYTIMACAKPLLVISGVNTPIHNFLKPLGCAYLITDRGVESQSKKVVDIISALTENKLELEPMGRAGFRHIEATYSKDVVASQYVKLGDRLLTNT